MAAVLACTAPADAGEGFVTKVRGRTLTLDKGANDGLEVGLEVTVVRPPDEAIIHPLTGENLGAPEIEIGGGQITKVSARAASVQLSANPIVSVRPGDVARFLTVEEKMVMDQEMTTETTEQAAKERGQIRSESSRLARNIGSIQGSIRGLEKAIRDLQRFDRDVVQPQFNSINRQIKEMRTDLEGLRETVMMLNAGAGQDIEGQEGEMSPDELEQLRLLVQEEVDKLEAQLRLVQPPVVDSLQIDELSVDAGLEGEMEGEQPIFAQLWFWALIGAVGLGGVAFWLYTRMAGASEEDEEDEEDDELDDEDEEEDDDDDIDVEEDEEDDIVVEETS